MNAKRNTVQKRLILDAVRTLDMHASAEQVYEYVVQKHPNVSKATVYRNLNQMAEAKEILNIGNFYGTAHYDHNCHKHHHFICDGCRSIFDVEVDCEQIIDRVSGKVEFDIADFNLTFSGLCRKCKTLSS